MRHVVAVGAGGNIGSHLAPHLVRLPGVSRVTLIDRDRYERGNLLSQDITERDIGRPKAEVQAARLRRVRPDEVAVEAIAAPVESLPWGTLRGDLVLSCLDSRTARQQVNQMVWRLGVPWIDAGVEGGGLLARISVYLPGGDRPCLECGWDERDYELLEQSYPCREGREEAPPSGSSSGLGALAAALQAVEARKVLEGALADTAYGREIILDASRHTVYLTSLPRNPECRLVGHEPWRIETSGLIPPELSLGDALERAPDGDDAQRWISVAGFSFAQRLVCRDCGEARELLCLFRALPTGERRCHGCGEEMEARAFDRVERLIEAKLPRTQLRRSLEALGLRPGELVTVGAGEQVRHFEMSRDLM